MAEVSALSLSECITAAEFDQLYDARLQCRCPWRHEDPRRKPPLMKRRYRKDCPVHGRRGLGWSDDEWERELARLREAVREYDEALVSLARMHKVG